MRGQKRNAGVKVYERKVPVARWHDGTTARCVGGGEGRKLCMQRRTRTWRPAVAAPLSCAAAASPVRHHSPPNPSQSINMKGPRTPAIFESLLLYLNDSRQLRAQQVVLLSASPYSAARGHGRPIVRCDARAAAAHNRPQRCRRGRERRTQRCTVCTRVGTRVRARRTSRGGSNEPMLRAYAHRRSIHWNNLE